MKSAPTFDERLRTVPWADYSTAYGPALHVAEQLKQLAGTDSQASLAASHDLWCGLCHQHAYVSSAALPALPFILEVLDHAGEKLTVEILDILTGFASCTRPGFDPSPPDWIAELRAGLTAERPRLERLATHPNEDIAGFALDVLAELELLS